MKEMFEIRVIKRLAEQYLSTANATSIASIVYKYQVERDDPLFKRIVELDRQYSGGFVSSWYCQRLYSEHELREAEALLLTTTVILGKDSEECGTIYDYSNACPYCRTGRTRKSPFVLARNLLPKRADVARTYQYEWICSSRVVETVTSMRLDGMIFTPVLSSVGATSGTGWFHLEPTTAGALIGKDTLIGGTYSRPEARDPCPDGHVLGLNRLSELHIERASYAEIGLQATAQQLGHVPADHMSPHPELIISPRAYDTLSRAGTRGLQAEVVHLDEELAPK